MAFMTWALKRQILYVIILVLFFSLLGFLIIYPRINKAPSCTDNKQNGNEMGIDCGGSCVKVCPAQADAVSVLWARTFKVAPGRYNAVAYLENHNKNAAIDKINYRFRFADQNNIYIGKREGSTFVPPSGKFAVFEPGIDIGNSTPIYTNFEFIQAPEWTTISEEKINQLKVSVSNINLVDENTNPVLSAVIKNNSLFTIKDMDIVAILYDADHNAVTTSQTYIDSLAGEKSKDISFTWPEPMPSKVIAKEIIPLYNIFSVELR